MIEKLIPINNNIKSKESNTPYKGVNWINTHDNSEKWLKSIYEIERKENETNGDSK